MNKKAQVIMFVIIGVVMIVAFSFIYFTRGKVATVESQEKLELATESLLKASALRAFVTNCLEEAAHEGISKIFRQGGFFFQDQDGATVDWDVETYDFAGTRVPYLIHQSDFVSEIENPPFYPCKRQAYIDVPGAGQLPTDTDDDGTLDYLDTDDDGDGVPDSLDLCTGTSSGSSVNVDGCAPGEAVTDTDDDGVVDNVDTDDDGDGVADSVDLCSGSSSGRTVDVDGCMLSQLPKVNPKLTKEGGCPESFTPESRGYTFGWPGSQVNLITPGLCAKHVVFPLCPCLDPSGFCSDSIQEQLENFIEYRTDECMDIQDMEKFFPGYTISKGAIDANLTVGVDDVAIGIAFPITLNYGQQSPITKTPSFSTRIPARVKDIYTIVHGGAFKGAVFRDINNLSFFLEEDMQNFINDPTNEYVKFIIDVIPVSVDTSIVVINDTSAQHFVNGKNLVFQFARKNRHPALNYVTDRNDFGFDLYIKAGEVINFFPVAFDPDEDALTYKYQGWKSDYDDVFHAPECDGSTFIEFEYVDSFADNLWEESLVYGFPEDTECLNERLKEPQPERCASYRTTCRDIGEHHVIINVTDPAGNYDYQNITILVDDVPTIIVETYPLFPYVLPAAFRFDHASIEDPFVLNASKTVNLLGGELVYRWRDEPVTGALEFDIQNAPDEIVIPEKPYQIQEPNPSRAFGLVGIHPIYIRAQDPMFPENIIEQTHEIEVHECLPHNNPEAPWPYPYNLPSRRLGETFTGDSNPYLASHVCCNLAGTYAGTGTKCYEHIDYGSADDLFDREKVHGTDIPIDFGVADFNNQQLLFKRTFIQYCSGSRGNICDGRIEHFADMERDCKVVAVAADKDAQCVGPRYQSQVCHDLPRFTTCVKDGITGLCDGLGHCLITT